MSAGSPY